MLFDESTAKRHGGKSRRRNCFMIHHLLVLHTGIGALLLAGQRFLELAGWGAVAFGF